MNNIFLKDKILNQVYEKLKAGDRLNADDGILLYESNDILGIGRMADDIRRARHGNKAFFVYNQHVNYTNVCINHCRFCAFSRSAGETGAFTLTPEDVKNQLLERIEEPVTEIHMVGGINPALPFQYYLDLLGMISSVRPDAVIKAFTAVEIDHLSKIAGLSVQKTIEILKDAGLAMVPGGGAEILNRRMHDKLFPKKIDGDQWLEIMEKIHASGLTSNATMLYGHLETIEERVAHLLRLRELQDRTHGFSAFIPLAFHCQNTALSNLPPTTAHDDLKTIAVARLILDNFDHIKDYWVMIGEKLAQVALSFGADDLDGTIIEEKITHMAGAKSARGLTGAQIHRLIETAGFEAVERDSFYNPVKG